MARTQKSKYSDVWEVNRAIRALEERRAKVWGNEGRYRNLSPSEQRTADLEISRKVAQLEKEFQRLDPWTSRDSSYTRPSRRNFKTQAAYSKALGEFRERVERAESSQRRKPMNLVDLPYSRKSSRDEGYIVTAGKEHATFPSKARAYQVAQEVANKTGKSVQIAQFDSVRKRRTVINEVRPYARDLSKDTLLRQSADSMETLYNSGRANKKDVLAWIRASAKSATGRIYQARYRAGASHDSLRLIRREDAEDKLFQKRKTRKSRDTSPRCPVGTKIQSVILDNQFFDRRDAVGWVRRHGFQARKVDTTPNSFRFRQEEPTQFASGSFRTISLRPGVQAVVGCPR